MSANGKLTIEIFGQDGSPVVAVGSEYLGELQSRDNPVVFISIPAVSCFSTDDSNTYFSTGSVSVTLTGSRKHRPYAAQTTEDLCIFLSGRWKA